MHSVLGILVFCLVSISEAAPERGDFAINSQTLLEVSLERPEGCVSLSDKDYPMYYKATLRLKVKDAQGGVRTLHHEFRSTPSFAREGTKEICEGRKRWLRQWTDFLYWEKTFFNIKQGSVKIYPHGCEAPNVIFFSEKSYPQKDGSHIETGRLASDPVAVACPK